MIGRRVYPDENGVLRFAPGDYGKDGKGEWHARPPSKPTEHLLGSLRNHQVTEHEDGTITVSPSIEIAGWGDQEGEVKWHGFLERGVWRLA